MVLTFEPLRRAGSRPSRAGLLAASDSLDGNRRSPRARVCRRKEPRRPVSFEAVTEAG